MIEPPDGAVRPVVYVSHPIKGLEPGKIVDLENTGVMWAIHNDMDALLPRTISPFCVVVGEPCKPDGSAGEGSDHTHGCFMRADLITMLENADTVLMMPGWELSVGCRAELNVALAAGIPVKIYEEQ